jgi:hypothetical protein
MARLTQIHTDTKKIGDEETREIREIRGRESTDY